jgi:type VI secretion system protein ImpL
MARFYEGYLRSFVSIEGSRYRLRGLMGAACRCHAACWSN